jgi:hypothetical protein
VNSRIVFLGWAANRRGVIVGSRVRKSRRILIEERIRSGVEKKSIDEHLVEIVENVSLKDIPLEERRKEANKPLFLIRYDE